jgi:hypothetical protein
MRLFRRNLMGAGAAYHLAVAVSGPALSLDFTTGTLDPRVTFARASSATYFDSSGTLVSAATNVPRFDYDPVTLAAKGLLIEESRTNLCLRSNEFGTSPWAVASASVSASANLGPDGSPATTLAVASAGNCFLYQSVAVTNAVVYTASVWARVTTGTGKTYLSTNGAVTDSIACSLTTAWQRFTKTFTADSSTHFIVIGNTASLSDATTNIEIFGAQMEAGAFATSYVPTTSAAVTRAAETASMTGTNFSSWYNQTEGTFVVGWTPSNIASGSKWAASVTAGSYAESIGIGHSAGTAAVNVYDGASAQALLSGPSVSVGVGMKSAAAYTVNDFAASHNGGTVATDTSGTLPTPDRLEVGTMGLTEYLNGHIKSLVYHASRKTNAELVTLSTHVFVSPLELFEVPGTVGAWYDFSDATKNFSDTGMTTPVTAGAGIAATTDLSGNAKHLLQATSGNRPLFSNGGATFDGVDDNLQTAPSVLGTTPVATIIAVVNPLALTGAGVIAENTHTTAVPLFGVFVNNGSDAVLGGGIGATSGNYFFADSTLIIGAPMNLLLNFAYDTSETAPNELVTRVAGVTGQSTVAASGAVSGSITTGQLNVGSRQGGAFPFNGVVLAMLEVNRLLTPTEITDIEAYFTTRYSL